MLLAPLLALALDGSAPPTFTPLVLVGDPAPTGGVVNIVLDLAVNSNGEWVAALDTTQTTAFLDDVVLGSAGVLYFRGQVFAEPPGATFVGAGNDLRLADDGTVLTLLLLNDPAALPLFGGVHAGTELVWGEDPTPAPAGFPAGSTLTVAGDPTIAGAGMVAVRAYVEQPGVSGTTEVVLVAVIDTATGDVLSQTVPLKEGDVVVGNALQNLGPYSPIVNGAGQVLARARFDPVGPIAPFDALLRDGVTVIQTNQAVPSAGAFLVELDRFAFNASGSWCLRGELAAGPSSDGVVLMDGGLVARESLPLAGDPAFKVHTIFERPVFLSDAGETLWSGQLDLPVPSGERRALFVDDTILVREGVTVVDGATVNQLDLGVDGFAMSANGRYVIFEAKLADGREGAFLVDREPGFEHPVAGVSALEGCGEHAACLAPAGGSVALGGTLDLELDGGQSPTAASFLFVAATALQDASGCGVPLGTAGELLLSPLPPNPLLTLGGAAGVGPTAFALAIPTTPGLAGVTVHAQGLFVDVGAEPLRLSTALTLLLGP